KEILVLSNGKKVVPNYLEGLLLSDACIDQAMVYGEGRNFLTALIVPHWGNVRHALNTQGINVDHENAETLSRHPAVISILRQRIYVAFKDVSGSEQIKKFVILPTPF